MQTPIYTIYAGVNGAGKSTFYLSQFYGNPCIGKRVNSDEILRENGGDWRNSTDQSYAMKESVKRIKNYLEEGISFNQETTLTGHSIIKNIKEAKKRGFIVNLYYVGLESADLAVQRVRRRVENGGHGIAEEDIRRRYSQSLQNLKKVIPLCDNVIIYDNSMNFNFIIDFKNGRENQKNPSQKFEWYEKFDSDTVHKEI